MIGFPLKGASFFGFFSNFLKNIQYSDSVSLRRISSVIENSERMSARVRMNICQVS
ncbi:hypothetical protein RchiOBHm_Chr7g0235621 [Rosa chinensis]|uniref:Uncharacterized protein n=1 Tax=Rosa chinensis TaxID=74649 RepID=A0A2P6PGQ1_ROSCH|nr:hypothetical protein RchiOBHm_Chr7g0235621 [Rosa chinensis]